MPITIVPTIADITVGGITWTHAHWEANTPGTISGIANAIGTSIVALGATTGSLVKAISGSTTLTGGEAMNLTFIFVGSLGGAAQINFPAGARSAVIANNTSGGYPLQVGYSSGSRAEIPYQGSASVYGDGSNFYLTDGMARGTTGNQLAGTLDVAGAATLASTLNVTGVADFASNATIAGSLDVTGAVDVVSTLDVHGAVGLFGAVNIQNTLSVLLDSAFLQDLGVGGDLGVSGDIISTGDIVGVTVAARHAAMNTVVYIDSPSGGSSTLEFASGAVPNWRLWKNSASDLQLDWLPSGVYTATPMLIDQATGYIRLLNLPSVAPLLSGALWNNAGVLNVA